jgi:FtsH-binding integral membrane protein
MAAKNSPMALPAFIGFSALNGFTLTFTLAYFDEVVLRSLCHNSRYVLCPFNFW